MPPYLHFYRDTERVVFFTVFKATYIITFLVKRFHTVHTVGKMILVQLKCEIIIVLSNLLFFRKRVITITITIVGIAIIISGVIQKKVMNQCTKPIQKKEAKSLKDNFCCHKVE